MKIARYPFKFRVNEFRTDRRPLTREAVLHHHAETLLLW